MAAPHTSTCHMESFGARISGVTTRFVVDVMLQL
jgi:hypothetical protein